MAMRDEGFVQVERAFGAVSSLSERAKASWEIRGSDANFLRERSRGRLPGGHAVTIVDLFSGCGGLSLGVAEAARQVGRPLDVRLAAELDPLIAGVYRRNFSVPEERMYGDVTTLFSARPRAPETRKEAELAGRVGQVDFLVGGPPCQGHSTLNNHTRGDDPKNQLYMMVVRAARVLKPRFVFIENVPAIERDRENVVEKARRELSADGYTVTTHIHSLVPLGVPQTRSRHVLVATRRGERLEVPEEARTEPRNLRWAIDDLEDARDNELDRPATLSADNLVRAQYFARNPRQYDLPNELRPPCQQGKHKYKSMYGRLSWDAPAQTITTGFGSPGQGRYLHPSRLRTITPHEAARIQFFPDWFDFSALPHRSAVAKAIGNAVPPKLSFVIALAALRRDDGQKAGNTSRRRHDHATTR